MSIKKGATALAVGSLVCITLSGLRWGVGVGAVYSSRVGPISLEVGVRDGGRTLVSLAVGWY